MAVFDELNKHQKIEDPEARKVEEIKRKTGRKKKRIVGSSVSLKSFRIASIAIGVIVGAIAACVIGYFVYQAILLYIGG